MEIFSTLTSFEALVSLYLFTVVTTIIATFLVIRSLRGVAPLVWQIQLTMLSLFLLVSGAISGWIVAKKLVGVPQIQNTKPAYHGTLDGISPNIEITFATPVDFKTIKIHTYPETELSIQTHGYLANKFSFGRSLTVVPQTNFPPGETVLLYLSNVEGPLTHGYGGEHMIEVKSPQVDVASISPENEAKDITQTQPFTVKLTSPSAPSLVWSAAAKPSHPLLLEQIDPTTLQITPREPFRQGVSYAITLVQIPKIVKSNDGEVVKELDAQTKSTFRFTTVRPAFISSLEPQGSSINPKENLQVEFDQPMDKESVENNIRISPTVPLTFSWNEDNSSLTVKHPEFTKDTQYSLTLGKGIGSQRGGKLEKDAVFSFKTAGTAGVVGITPTDRSIDIAANTAIAVTFDQPVKDSAAKNFSVAPTVSGKAQVAGDKLTFTADKPLAYDTTYTIRITKGVEGLYGNPSTQDYTFTFKTAPNQTVLSVPFYRQQEAFTCNIAAARMLLAYRGVNVTEADIKSLTGIGGKRGSGNPHKGYIDDYGTYWEPISKAVSAHRPIRMITSGNLSDITVEIVKGNPVMTWGQNGWSDPHDLSWTSTDGTFIKAVNGMHSSVVRGFRGSADNPTHIMINDPWRGQYTIDTKEFMRRWSFLFVAMAID